MVITPSQTTLFWFHQNAFFSSQYQNATINNEWEWFLKIVAELNNQLNAVTFKTVFLRSSSLTPVILQWLKTLLNFPFWNCLQRWFMWHMRKPVSLFPNHIFKIINRPITHPTEEMIVSGCWLLWRFKFSCTYWCYVTTKKDSQNVL